MTKQKSKAFQRCKSNIMAYNKFMTIKRLNEMTVPQLLANSHPTERPVLAKQFYEEGKITLAELNSYEISYREWLKYK